MCVSAVVENDIERVAARLGITQLQAVGTDHDLPRRIEARDSAWIVRLGSGGRLVAEAMSFNPYTLKRSSLMGDMWAESMLGSNRGILVLKGFSEWVSLGLLLSQGIIPLHEANCAFNRFAHPDQRYGGRGDHRMVLANFTPEGAAGLLVPVLFDQQRKPDREDAPVREFAIVSEDSVVPVMAFGAEICPASLTLEGALEWLDNSADEGEEEAECDPSATSLAVLEQPRAQSLVFGLFKAA